MGQPPVGMTNRQRIVRDKALGERLLVSFTRLFRFGEIVPKIRPNEPLARRASDLDGGFVNVSDFAFGADSDQGVQAGFNQTPGILRGLFLSGDIADRAHGQHAFLGFQGAQADLDLELGAVFALAEQFKPGTHGACRRFSEETCSMSGVGAAEALGNEYFDRLPEEFLACVTEQFNGLGIDENDPATLVDDHEGVGSGFEQSAKFLLRLLAPSDVARGGERAQYVALCVLINRGVIENIR